MKIEASLTLSLCSILFLSAPAQTQMFTDAFDDFSSGRLWTFEEIPIRWKMDGILQADLNEGLNNLLEGNPKVAVADLTKVLKKDSTIWQAYYYRAAARKELREFIYAEMDMRRALKLYGDFYEGFVELAKILYLRRQIQDSERAINRAVRLDRSRGAAYYLKGDINMSEKDMRNAIRNYKDCLAADSLFHDARIKLALLDALAQNNVGAAIEHLDKVLSYDSLQKNALLFRSILVYQKDKRQSARDLSNLILVSPNSLIALYYRGLVLAELAEFDRAFGDFQKVIKATSTDDNSFLGRQTWLDKKIDLQNAGAYTVSRMYGLSELDRRRLKQAFCFILIGEYAKAIDVIGKISNYYQEPAAVYLKAVACEHMGVHKAAFEYYNMALALDNQIADAYKKRGIYEQELKQWAKSIEDFTTVLKLNPASFFTNRMRGVSYYHMNRFQDAIDDFNIYLKNDSTNKEVRGFRGMAYLNTNQRLKGYVDFALSDNQQALDFKDMEKLADSVLQAGDTAQALYCLGAITENAPYFTEGYVQMFRIHVARNEWKAIADNISNALANNRPDAAKSGRSYLLAIQALLYARDSHKDDALRTLNEAIRFDGKNGFAYMQRGRLFLEMGKTSKAEDDLRKASALGSPEAKQILAAMAK